MGAQRRLRHQQLCLAPPPSHPLAAPTRLGHAVAPLDVGFGRGEWPPEGSRGPIFEPYTLDTEALHRDGYAILPSIMLPETRRRWKAACQAVQALNDRLLLETDWSAVDWPAVGLEQPAEHVSPADLQGSLGGCQLPAHPGVKAAGFSHYLHRDVPGLAFGWGGFPEAHSVEHSGFFQYVAAHPDMLRLHSALLGVPANELRFDHGERTRTTQLAAGSARYPVGGIGRATRENRCADRPHPQPQARLPRPELALPLVQARGLTCPRAVRECRAWALAGPDALLP